VSSATSCWTTETSAATSWRKRVDNERRRPLTTNNSAAISGWTAWHCICSTIRMRPRRFLWKLIWIRKFPLWFISRTTGLMRLALEIWWIPRHFQMWLVYTRHIPNQLTIKSNLLTLKSIWIIWISIWMRLIYKTTIRFYILFSALADHSTDCHY